jgi:hypothetical protein
VPVPCNPEVDNTVVCKCKGGSPAACDALAKTYPETLKGILRLAAMAQAAQEAGKAKAEEKAKTQVIDSTGCGSGQDPNEKQECTGQWHHIISKAVWYALENHAVLKGKYTYRDSRFVTRAKDLKDHCGYQDWHRALDAKIRAWLAEHGQASVGEFEAFLREMYARPDLRARFPNGF